MLTSFILIGPKHSMPVLSLRNIPNRFIYLLLAASLFSSLGCQVLRCGSREPDGSTSYFTSPSPTCLAKDQLHDLNEHCRWLGTAWPASGSHGELSHAFLELACDARKSGDPRSPDYFYQAARHSWCWAKQGPNVIEESSEACQIYHACLKGLLAEAQHYGRFRCGGTLVVYQPEGPLTVPLIGVGLSWSEGDISDVFVSEDEGQNKLTTYHCRPGFGIPVVAIRGKPCVADMAEKFHPPQTPFAATVVLRPDPGSLDGSDAVLEFHNPLTMELIHIDGDPLILARDISAPLEFKLRSSNGTGFLGFLDPSLAEQGDGLRFMEPYQPGKIPIIFVHGLLSDPTAWFDVANDLRTMAWFNENFQIWGFSYATGRPFITSAMLMRQECNEAIAMLDPQGRDPALRQMVLVGHSMGGLVSRLQVSASGSQLWESIANVPLESINADADAKQELAKRFFFEPQDCVSRVVYIATPHQGSSYASRGIGRLASSLVEPSMEVEAFHRQLMTNNPGIFVRQYQRRIPTSVDMLEPSDPTLQKIYELPVPLYVKQHSIIGIGRTPLTLGATDGVVPVSSAKLPGVCSEQLVAATHNSILKHPETKEGLIQILRQHLNLSKKCVGQP